MCVVRNKYSLAVNQYRTANSGAMAFAPNFSRLALPLAPIGAYSNHEPDPEQLPVEVTEPLIYLSALQARVIQRRFPSLDEFTLPAWVPQRLIARDLGYTTEGVKRAMRITRGVPFLWATEFENVHDLWSYDEPRLVIGGRDYEGSENYYKEQQRAGRAAGHDSAWWDARRDEIMRVAIRAKFNADPALHTLLCATVGHPLLAIKGDGYWGVDPRTGGTNRLAQLWMELRDQVC